MELPHILCHRKGQVKQVIICPRHLVISTGMGKKFYCQNKTTEIKQQKTTTKLPILINSNISYFLPITTPFSHAILHTSLYRRAPFLCFTLKSPCLRFCSFVAPAFVWGYSIFSDRKHKRGAARLTEEETHATFSFYLP